MNKIAIIDLDDTIVDLVPCFLNTFNKKYNQNLTADDWVSYDMYTRYGITPDEFSNLLIDEHIFENCKPIVNAKIIIDRIEEQGYSINYLTARKWHPNGYNVTRDWLLQHGFTLRDNSHLHITDLGELKSKYVESELGRKVNLVIDDNARHVRSFITDKMADRVFLINQPWNLLDDDLEYHRIADINEINHFIDIGYI